MKENPTTSVPLSLLLGLGSDQIATLASLQRDVERTAKAVEEAHAAMRKAESQRAEFLAELGIVEPAIQKPEPAPLDWASPTPQPAGWPEVEMPAPSALERGAAAPAITELPAPPAPEGAWVELEQNPPAVVELVEEPVHEQEVKRPEAGLKAVLAARQWKAWAAANGKIAIKDASELLGVPAPTLGYRLSALKIAAAEEPDRPTHRPTLYWLKDIEANREELAKPLRQKATETLSTPVFLGPSLHELKQAAVDHGKAEFERFTVQQKDGEFRAVRASSEGKEEGWVPVERWARGGTGAWEGQPLGGAVGSDGKGGTGPTHAISGAALEARGVADKRSDNGKVN